MMRKIEKEVMEMEIVDERVNLQAPTISIARRGHYRWECIS